ncbi:MAG: methyltransferase domain-containing protein [Nanoarchaeota archaeon]
MKDADYVKSYFQSPGTVAEWWNPTEGDFAHVYYRQMQQVKQWIEQCQPRTCLEVSCGKGRVTSQLEQLCFQYVGSDISSEMISLARARCTRATFIQGDAEQLAHPEESFDAVVCLEALVHYPNPGNALKEFHRVLKKDGVLIIDSDNRYSLRRLIKRVYLMMTGVAEFGADIFRPYSKQEFTTSICRAGLQIEAFTYFGVASPIRISAKERTMYIISPVVSRYLDNFKLDALPLLQQLATYHLVKARKK